MSDYDDLCRIAPGVSRETYDHLKRFQSEFEAWNSRINLSSSGTMKEFWSRHVLDSAQIWSIAMKIGESGGSWVDLGSGGGLPGMVIAILNKEKGFPVTLIESNRKKTGFLHSVNARTGAGAVIRSGRIEDEVIHVKQPDFVTARALAPLDKLLSLSHPLFSERTRAFFPKGRGYRQEIEESRRNWSFDLVEHDSAIDVESSILEIRRPVRR
ncbi:16S rRNA (guanine(527)-N(7))-methyltransferase RsmG [Zhengella sp. ZM62]|uniref:16S rRNA (guanine(527)-N(7))-methyltransferase RsmG n=1 Tax=Zhengella sedimenti TaxID=3390035 RepID=UPI0039757A43